MQPRARRVSQGNQRIRGQWRPSFSLSLYAVFRAWNGPSDDVGDVGDLIIWFPLHGRPDSRGEAQWTPPSRRRTDGGGDIFLPMHLCDSETGAVDVFRH